MDGMFDDLFEKNAEPKTFGYTDADLLDWLQDQLDKKKFTGKCAFRWSELGTGFELCETSHENAVEDVRVAIAIAKATK